MFVSVFILLNTPFLILLVLLILNYSKSGSDCCVVSYSSTNMLNHALYIFFCNRILLMLYDAYSYIIGSDSFDHISDTGSWNFICPIHGMWQFT